MDNDEQRDYAEEQYNARLMREPDGERAVIGMNLSDLQLIITRLINEGEGRRTLVFLPAEQNSSGEPEIWAVTDEVADSVPGLLYVATVDVTEAC